MNFDYSNLAHVSLRHQENNDRKIKAVNKILFSESFFKIERLYVGMYIGAFSSEIHVYCYKNMPHENLHNFFIYEDISSMFCGDHAKTSR